MSSFIKTLKNSKNEIVLYKLNETILNQQPKKTTLINETIDICFLDLETTGFNLDLDKIIEIAIKLVKIDKNDGGIIEFLDYYESFQDPHQIIENKITQITGITNEMVSGFSIDWEIVKSIIDKADILLAHNAKFDRGFLDRYLPLSKDKLWTCSIGDINWIKRGFTKNSLELLSIWHGFYYESHRAMNDVDAVIHLLTHHYYNDTNDDKPILELIENSQQTYYKVIANNSPFEKKDMLRANSYIWNPKKKYWWKRTSQKQAETEKNWLANNIYNGYFNGSFEKIEINDRYKN